MAISVALESKTLSNDARRSPSSPSTSNESSRPSTRQARASPRPLPRVECRQEEDHSLKAFRYQLLCSGHYNLAKGDTYGFLALLVIAKA